MVNNHKSSHLKYVIVLIQFRSQYLDNQLVILAMLLNLIIYMRLLAER